MGTDSTGEFLRIGVVGEGPATIEVVTTILAADVHARITAIAGEADVNRSVDPRVAEVFGTVIGVELREEGGVRMRLSIADKIVESEFDAFVVEIDQLDADHWAAVLTGIGAVTHSPEAARVLDGRGSVLVGGTRFAVDMHWQSSVDRVFLLPAAEVPESNPLKRGIAVGTSLVALAKGSVSQHFRDRIIYDLLWSVDRVRLPDHEVEDVLRRAAETFGGIDAVRFLDLGCGRGRNALYAAAQGAQVTAVDHSTRAVTKLRRHAAAVNQEIRLCATDMVEWARKHQERAEVVISICAVHHASPDPSEIARILRDMADLLVPGGFLLIALLTDISYGDQPPPPGRLMVTADEGEALLTRALHDLKLLDIHRLHRRDDDVVHFNVARHELGVSYYEAVRVTALLRRG